MRPPNSWQNWSRLVRVAPRRLERPRTIEDIRDVVRSAAANGQSVRVPGSGHSFSAVAAPDNVHVDLRDCADAHGVRVTDPAAAIVDVGAASTIAAIGRQLFDRELALLNIGDIDQQTLGGALLTGTHGTGARLGCMATNVVGMTMVLPDGQVIDCDREREPELFHCARVSLGLLGVVTRLKLRVRPRYRLRDRRWCASIDEIVARAQVLAAEHDRFEFFWFPQGQRAFLKSLDETTDPLAPRRIRRFFVETILENLVLFTLLQLVHRRWFSPRQIAAFAEKLGEEAEFVNWAHAVYPTPRLIRFREMEHAVPSERGIECFLEIQHYVRSKQPLVAFPVEVRWVAADDIPLSPFCGRDSMTIAVHQYWRDAHEPYFAAVEAICRNHGGRPHWGKVHTLGAADVAGLYPEFDRFRALLERIDPAGVFLNRHLATVFRP